MADAEIVGAAFYLANAASTFTTTGAVIRVRGVAAMPPV
jgi:hypothetical protein